jgi:hypothetical protein
LPAACRQLTPLDKYFDSRPFLFRDVVTLRVRNVGFIVPHLSMAGLVMPVGLLLLSRMLWLDLASFVMVV